MTAPRPARPDDGRAATTEATTGDGLCRCGFCLALLRAIASAERIERARRNMVTVIDGGRTPDR